MRTATGVIGVAFGVAGCGRSEPAPAAGALGTALPPSRVADARSMAARDTTIGDIDSRATARGGEFAAGDRRVAFRCDDGQAIEVRFAARAGVAALARGGRTTELQQQPSGSGFRYEGAGVTLTGKGDTLMLAVGQAAPVRCRAVR